MSSVALALYELRRAPGRFVRLGAAVALLTLLVVVQQAFLSGLVGQMNAGLRTSDADLLVLGGDAAGALPASSVPESAVGVAAAVPGVEAAGSLRFGSATAVMDGEQLEVSLVGVDPGRPGAPSGMATGRAARSGGEAVASGTDTAGLAQGAAVRLLPGDRELRVVGIAEDAGLAVAPTLYVTTTAFLDIARLQRPDVLTPPRRSAVAVRVAPGHDVAAVRARLATALGDVDVLTPVEAAAHFPGVAEVSHSFAIVLGLLGVIVALVAGMFFLILTVRKRATLALLHAGGIPMRALVAVLAVQVVVVVGAGIAGGTAAAALLIGSVDVGFDAAVAPAAAARAALAMLAMVAVACAAAVRRTLRVDPAALLTGSTLA